MAKTKLIRKKSINWGRFWSYLKSIPKDRADRLISLAALIIAAVSLILSNKALGLTRTQFENANQPFLQIVAMQDTFTVVDGKPFVFRYKLKNLGNYPVKILASAKMIKFLDFQITSKNITGATFHPELEYISDLGMPATIMTYPITKGQADSLKANIKAVYIFAFYKYQNLLTKKLNKFEIVYKFNNGSIDVIHNENYPIDE